MVSQFSHRPARGFTLLETMVAAALFALTLMGVLTIMNTQWNVLDKNAERLYVGHVLQSRLEEIRDLTFDELDALPAEIDFEPLPATTVYGKSVNPELGGLEHASDPYALELREAFGTVYIDPLGPDLRRVTVEVAWKSGFGSSEVTMTSATYITRNGVNRQ